MTRGIAVSFALAAFSIALVAGLAADNQADVIIARALTAMFVCYLIGSVGGAVFSHVAVDHARELVRAAPIEGEEVLTGTAEDQALSHVAQRKRREKSAA